MPSLQWANSALGRLSQEWRRQVESRVEEALNAGRRREQGEVNGNKSQLGSIKTLGDTIRALPLPAAQYSRVDAFTLNPALSMQQTIAIPAGKTTVSLTVIGNVAALDATSGGFAVAYATITVSGTGFAFSSPQVSASKDAGASQVNNILTPAFGIQQSGLTPGGTLTITLAVSASNPSAFPARAGNYATLTVQAIFFD